MHIFLRVCFSLLCKYMEIEFLGPNVIVILIIQDISDNFSTLKNTI